MYNYGTKADNTAPADGGILSAAEDNNRFTELKNAATTSGLSLTSPGSPPGTTPDADSYQLAQAMARYASGGIWCQDSGSANAYVLASPLAFKLPKSYFAGMAIRFRAANANTGASTVNVNSIGSKKIMSPAGDALVGGEIAEDGWTEAVYDPAADSSAGAFLIVAWADASKRAGVPKNVVFITSSGTYTPSSDDVSAIEVELVGAGGGGGGADGQGAGTGALGIGGHGGGRAIKFIRGINGVTYSATVTIGAAGAGGAAGNNAGADGGDTSFDDGTISFSTPGGRGGTGQLGSANNSYAPLESEIGTSGDINIGTTRSGEANIVNSYYGHRSEGGPSLYGASTRPGSNTTPGDSTGYGAGGTGAACRDTTGNYGGASGSPGLAIIKEY